VDIGLSFILMALRSKGARRHPSKPVILPKQAPEEMERERLAKEAREGLMKQIRDDLDQSLK
jgi:hypothetical protein